MLPTNKVRRRLYKLVELSSVFNGKLALEIADNLVIHMVDTYDDISIRAEFDWSGFIFSSPLTYGTFHLNTAELISMLAHSDVELTMSPRLGYTYDNIYHKLSQSRPMVYYDIRRRAPEYVTIPKTRFHDVVTSCASMGDHTHIDGGSWNSESYLGRVSYNVPTSFRATFTSRSLVGVDVAMTGMSSIFISFDGVLIVTGTTSNPSTRITVAVAPVSTRS